MKNEKLLLKSAERRISSFLFLFSNFNFFKKQNSLSVEDDAVLVRMQILKHISPLARGGGIGVDERLVSAIYITDDGRVVASDLNKRYVSG